MSLQPLSRLDLIFVGRSMLSIVGLLAKAFSGGKPPQEGPPVSDPSDWHSSSLRSAHSRPAKPNLIGAVPHPMTSMNSPLTIPILAPSWPAGRLGSRRAGRFPKPDPGRSLEAPGEAAGSSASCPFGWVRSAGRHGAQEGSMHLRENYPSRCLLNQKSTYGGTVRGQTLLGTCLSMVGPEGFEPPTKRL